VNILNKQTRTTNKGWSSSLGRGFRRGDKNSTPWKKKLVTKCYTGPRNWRVLVNTVMTFWVPLQAGNSLT